MKKVINWLKGAFENVNSGASARKLASFTIIICIVAAHTSWIKNCFMNNDFSLLTSVLTIDYAFIATCLGMTTYQNIKQNTPLVDPEKKE